MEEIEYTASKFKKKKKKKRKKKRIDECLKHLVQ